MRKINLFFGFLILFFVPAFFSCNTSKVINTSLDEVHPLALLNQDFSIYMYLPVQHHKELFNDIILAEIPSLSKSDAEKISNQINNLYAGLGTVKDRSKLQMACDGDFPSIAVKMVFKEKNGWSGKNYLAKSSQEALEKNYPNEFTIFYSNETNYKISFCSENLLSLASDIEPMLENYAIRPALPETKYAKYLTENQEENLSGEKENILFYISRPGQYVKALLGSSITMGLGEAYGYLEYLPNQKKADEYSGKYSLNIYLSLSKAAHMKAFLSGLKLAMGMMGGEIRQIDEKTVGLFNLEVTEKSIINLITRDPITGKHFKVDGENIIKESKGK